MSSHPSRRQVQRLGIGLIAASMALMAVGTVMAHTGSPSSIGVVQTTGLSVQASGNWTWPAEASSTKLSYVGYAIDWGDVTSGNVIGTYHIGDGTSATNLILQPTTPAQGTGGTWGPATHTYATPGVYTVCVIIYDLGTSKPFITTGYHSTQAAGTGRNTDNSVDHNQQVPAMCGQINLLTPTASPTTAPTTAPTAVESPTAFESFQGETSGPTTTPPPTGTVVPTTPDQGVPTLPLFLLIGSALASLFVVRSVKVNR
jgi:hypothetical protein